MIGVECLTDYIDDFISVHHTNKHVTVVIQSRQTNEQANYKKYQSLFTEHFIVFHQIYESHIQIQILQAIPLVFCSLFIIGRIAKKWIVKKLRGYAIKMACYHSLNSPHLLK